MNVDVLIGIWQILFVVVLVIALVALFSRHRRPGRHDQRSRSSTSVGWYTGGNSISSTGGDSFSSDSWGCGDPGSGDSGGGCGGGGDSGGGGGGCD